ncbi:transmembrane amino acid transporter protein-domain-containing protein [Sporodiniella umbellata]|nr:transmembrane amino acid transporter protein-domain-containing protein [Sporodiniella umbellata]
MDQNNLSEDGNTQEKKDQFSCQYIEEDNTSHTTDFGHGNGNFSTAYFNIVCVVAGTGTLGLPKAFAMGGWLGLLILFLAYIMSIYSGIVLIRCLYYKPGHRLHDFKEIGTAAFGKVGYWVASILHIVNIFGCPALYLVLASANMSFLLQGTRAELTYKTWVIIWSSFLLIPGLVMKTLKEVTAFSAVGAISTMIAVFVVVIQGPMHFHAHPEIVVNRSSVIWDGFPLALSTIAFSFGGNNTYPHVEHALKKPHQWKWALFAGLSTCVCLYVLTAVTGYWSFGDAVQSPVYRSLPEGTAKLLSTIVMTIHVVLAIPIFSTSFSLELEKSIGSTEERFGKLGAWAIRATIRSIVMVILAVLACFVPY